MDTIDVGAAAERHAYDGTTCRVLIGRVLDLIANKWSVPIILALGRVKGPMRFTELGRAIPIITQKELTKQLRELSQSASSAAGCMRWFRPRSSTG